MTGCVVHAFFARVTDDAANDALGPEVVVGGLRRECAQSATCRSCTWLAKARLTRMSLVVESCLQASPTSTGICTVLK